MLDEIGGAPEGFDLQAYSQRSFGVFQSEIEDVTLRVLPAHVDEVSRWMFHSLQTSAIQSDGAMLIYLRGSGMNELAWSLFRWGGKIEIIGPPALKQAMQAALTAAQGMVAYL
jgi:predicted DNA-binding transcriptional regulator YafY